MCVSVCPHADGIARTTPPPPSLPSSQPLFSLSCGHAAGVLLQTTDAQCDYPLQLFLGLYAVLQCFVMILHISRRPGVRMDEQPRWIQHTENSLGMVTFSLFMVGNVWTFNTETCDPTLQTACLTLILFVYATLALPIFLILLIIFCLPCMVVFLPFFLRYFPGNQDSAYPSPHCVKIRAISSFFISQT